MSLSKRDKTILIALAVILIIVCYVELFLIPMTDKISQISQDTKDINMKLGKMSVTAEKYNENKKIKEDLDSKVEDASDELPGIAKEPEITYDLKKQADKAGVTIASVSFSPASDFDPLTLTKPGEKVTMTKFKIPQGKLMNMPANVVYSGTYSAVLNFINNVESDKRIAEVQNLNISSSGQSKLQISMGINYYYLNKNDKSTVKYDFLQNSSAYGKSDIFSK